MAVRIGVSYVADGVRGQHYLEALRAAGAEPVILTTEQTLPQWPTAEKAKALFDPENPAVAQLDDLDGLLLTGGGDVDPMLYGEVIAGSGEPHWPRDHVETAQFHRARARKLPILGICRGIQFLNVAMGGSLVQHVPAADNHRHPQWKGSASHLVRVPRDSVLARIIADGVPSSDLEVGVNSYHHQAVSPERLAPGLVATATSAAEGEGETVLLEGLESGGTREGSEFLLGVQWHPERVDDVAPTGAAQPVAFRVISRRLFRAFVRAAEESRLRDEGRELVALQV